MIKASILIRPAVFYEFIRRRQLNNEIDYLTQRNKIRELIKDNLEVDTLFEGLSSYDEAIVGIKKIQHDEKK